MVSPLLGYQNSSKYLSCSVIMSEFSLSTALNDFVFYIRLKVIGFRLKGWMAWLWECLHMKINTFAKIIVAWELNVQSNNEDFLELMFGICILTRPTWRPSPRSDVKKPYNFPQCSLICIQLFIAWYYCKSWQGCNETPCARMI